MANIRALAKGLLAGRRSAVRQRRIGGWVRVDLDNVMRGWAWDGADPARRLLVRLFVDGKPVAEVVADRFDPKLLELGHGDGRYGFALVIPAAFRDDREHAFEAVVEEAGYRLMSKARTFVIERDAHLPRLHLLEVTPEGLRAQMRGGQYAKDTPLELWSAGQRVEPALLTASRHREGPQAEWRLSYPREVFFGLDRAAQVAAPGMVEARSGAASLFGGVRLHAEAGPDGLSLWLDGPLSLDGEAVAARVLAGDNDRLVVAGAIALGQDPAILHLPTGAAVDGARVEIIVDGRALAALTATVGAGQPEDADPPANLIRNADLTDWPNGVVVRGGPARFETARGWHALNHKSSASLRAMATPLDDEGQACSLTLAAAKVGGYCRLEAEVESRASLAGRRLVLDFEAAVANGALEAFRSPDDFALIDRIFLAPPGGQAGAGVTIARKVLLTRDLRSLRFSFETPADLLGSDFVLAFDFKQPSVVTLQRPQLRLAGAADAAAPPALAFEDHGVEVQAGMLKGLESWVSPDVVTAPPAPGVELRAAPRWDFAPASQGSIEVVICMHDAAHETLACLRSLVSGSALPHLVRIIDDASGEDSRRRIEAYIADKPWMRLDPNPRHLGYTASANRGVRTSGADWVVLLNSDAEVGPGWLEGLLEAARTDPKTGFVGPLSNAASYQSVPDILDRAGKLKVNDLPPDWTVSRMAAFVAEHSERAFPEIPLLNGFCTLIRREAFMELGGFDEAVFPMGYGEENDLCLRAAAAGWKLLVADNVYVHHAKSASFGAKRRAGLAAEGSAALRRLHPDVDFSALGQRMREIEPLARMRAVVRAAYRGETA
jgi:GT2 family glycosyltransferase